MRLVISVISNASSLMYPENSMVLDDSSEAPIVNAMITADILMAQLETAVAPDAPRSLKPRIIAAQLPLTISWSRT